mmetsp:Transcript_4514/g.10208  ORF Transcript_4514/g.10208 Transcript_4514/m.10208 type:complete len:650 (+) Transcript_4514:63-2012(+)
MADCSASGTAIDRVIQTAIASTLNQGQGNNGSSSAAAASAVTQASSNFMGGTAATASGPAAMGMMDGASAAAQRQIMPLAPMDVIGRNGVMMQNQNRQGSMMGADNSAARLDDAWAASSTTAMHSSQQAAPMGHMMQQPHHQQQHMQQGQMMSMHPAPQMMMQQQQQMMMMQQMQMQQHQMAAMVQYQQQQQQQKMMAQQKEASIMKQQSMNSAAYETATAVDDDVATVSEEEQLNNHHEGLAEDASIERLAQAWRDAESEFAQEFDGEEDYDVSDLGGLYTEGHQEATATNTDTATDTNTANNDIAEPQYEFSEASQTYGCIQTPTTDIPPQNLSYPENLYEQGLQHFDEGNISEAILCFESTLRNIDPEHADAWRMLGKCHTENDEDQRAIVCWLRSLERDPFSPETLLALGVAYVNELDHERAIETLRGWVANHPLYAGMVDDTLGKGEGEEEEDMYGSASGEEEEMVDGTQRRRMRAQTMVEMRDVERLLLRALEYDRTADAAADVYEALGVVYNVSRDYDAAVNAFRRAIDVRPEDYQLRNKLGATLANGNRSDEALPSYNVALRLKPKYARGWLNMAISHSNLYNYSEAARCYLQTLSLNPDARHVWSYLRIALTCDEKWELLSLAASQNLSAFHDHFDFVEY